MPEENWLPINREELELIPQMRVGVPELEKLNTWQAPKAEKLSRQTVNLLAAPQEGGAETKPEIVDGE